MNKYEIMKDNYALGKNRMEDFWLLVELVERATPMKVIYNNNMCPECMLLVNGAYEREHMNYCPRCGQALEWSDKNEKLS